jgi:phospholipid/cholesterol/gamma-HCH transport system substrate-binding protein
MEHDAKYLAVGLFVIAAAALAAVFLVWYSGSRDHTDYGFYEIYFDGTVSGLTRGGPVRYLGVDVGRVRRLEIDPADAGRVRVVAEIDQSAPIDGATRASLGLQGVTGLLYIDLKQADGVAPGMPLKKGEQYPVIESEASNFDLFIESLPKLLDRATALVDRVSLILSKSNVEALSSTVENLRAASESLPRTSREVGRLVTDFRATLHEVDSVARELNGTVKDARPEIRTTLEKLTVTANDLASISGRLDAFLDDTESRVDHFTDQGLLELEQLLRDGRAAALEFRDLSRSLREDPSQIVYQPPQGGVEVAP